MVLGQGIGIKSIKTGTNAIEVTVTLANINLTDKVFSGEIVASGDKFGEHRGPIQTTIEPLSAKEVTMQAQGSIPAGESDEVTVTVSIDSPDNLSTDRQVTISGPEGNGDGTIIDVDSGIDKKTVAIAGAGTLGVLWLMNRRN